MDAITFLRADSESAKESIEDYAAEARNNAAPGGIPPIPPPTDAQLSQNEVALTPPTVPKKRPRGRPPKLKKKTQKALKT